MISECTRRGPLLVLGGTADGRVLAQRLHAKNIALIYSIAGLVRKPQLDCQLLVGGFSQFGGIERYVRQHHIPAILDITHPYAQRMSEAAARAAQSCGIAYWRFHRAQWQQQCGDNWQRFASWEDLLPALAGKRHIFVTTGQVAPHTLERLLERCHSVLLRTAVKPKNPLPERVHWVKAIGPFEEKQEMCLMRRYGIDALVSKNSGGDSTIAKLTAARGRHIPVYMLDRPVLPAADKLFLDRQTCEEFVLTSREYLMK